MENSADPFWDLVTVVWHDLQFIYQLKNTYVPDWVEILLGGVFACLIIYRLYKKFTDTDVRALPDEEFSSTDEMVIHNRYKICVISNEATLAKQDFILGFLTVTNVALYFLPHSWAKVRGSGSKAKMISESKWIRIEVDGMRLEPGRYGLLKYVEVTEKKGRVSIKISNPLLGYPQSKLIYRYLLENYC
ncbi:MAG: hypothetical protein ACJ0BH_04555 [Candidatus Puniceispirillaceae bacterium]